MRGAEKYFAEGRDAANYALLQQQMRRAGDWRIGLRRNYYRADNGREDAVVLAKELTDVG